MPLEAADVMAGYWRRFIEQDPKLKNLDMKKLRVSDYSKFINDADLFKFAQAHTRHKLIPVLVPRRLSRSGSVSDVYVYWTDACACAPLLVSARLVRAAVLL
jgi:hypothetical protein